MQAKPPPKKLTLEEQAAERLRLRLEAPVDYTMVCANKKPKKPGIQSRDKLDDDLKAKYMSEIEDLERIITKYQERCDRLTIANETFDKKFEQLEKDRQDVVEHLDRCFKHVDDQVPPLKAELVEVREVKVDQHEGYEKQLEELKDEMTTELDNLSDLNVKLNKDLKAMEAVDDDQKQLMEWLEWFARTLEEKEREHQKYMYNKDRSQTIENIRVNREIKPRVKSVADECMVLAREQMRQEKRQHIRQCARLHYQMSLGVCERVESLIGTNNQLKTDIENNQTVIDTLQSSCIRMNRELSHQAMVIAALVGRYQSDEKILEELTIKLHLADRDLANEVEMGDEEVDILTVMRVRIDQQMLAVSEKQERENKTRIWLRKTVRESTKENTRTADILRLLKDSAPVLRHIFKDALEMTTISDRTRLHIEQVHKDLERLHCVGIKPDFQDRCPAPKRHALRPNRF